MPRDRKRKKSKTSSDNEYQSLTKNLSIDLERGKRYAHTAPCSYKIIMASLQADERKISNCACNIINMEKGHQQHEDKVYVIVEHDLKEYLICVLDCKKLQQCKLNIKFRQGEQVAFRTIGRVPVHLSGTVLKNIDLD